MWSIINDTPFKAGHQFVRCHKTGGEIWLVAVKATFDFDLEGRVKVAEEQVEVFGAPVFRGEEDESALLYDTDLVPPKSKVDLLLSNVKAYAPAGEEVTRLHVSASIDGLWSKTLKVTGNRCWEKSLGILFTGYVEPFTNMEISYENAYGGNDSNAPEEWQLYPDNPVGKGYANKRSRLKGLQLPNIEYPHRGTKKRWKGNVTAGLGPIPAYWRSRAGFAGTYDAAWENDRVPLLPLDFNNKKYFQSAPEDQQIECLYGGEIVNLNNLLPEREALAFQLPEIEFKFETRLKNEMISHSGQIKTLIIEPENRRFSMVWQTSLPCQNREQFLKYTHISYNMGKLL